MAQINSSTKQFRSILSALKYSIERTVMSLNLSSLIVLLRCYLINFIAENQRSRDAELTGSTRAITNNL